MKKIFLFFISIVLVAQDKYYDNTYTILDVNTAQAMVKSNDKYILSGSCLDDNLGYFQATKFEIDQSSQEMSHVFYSDSSYTDFRDIVVNDNYYCMPGAALDSIQEIRHYFTLESLDTIIANKTIFLNPNVTGLFRSVAPYSDKGFLMIGETLTGGQFQTMLYCIDSLGNKLWDKIYDFPGNTRLVEIVPNPLNNGFYISGIVDVDYSMNFIGDGLLVSIDSLGNILWDKMYDSGGRESINGNILITKNKELLVGYIGNNIEEDISGVLKLDSLGNIIWENLYLFPTSGAQQIVETQDENYLLAGSSRPTGNTFLIGQLTKLDTSGNVLWTRYYGDEDGQDYIYDMLLEEDGSIVMCGRTQSGGIDGADVWLLKTNCLGLFTEPQSNFDYQVNETQVLFENLSDFVYPDSIDGGHFLWNFGDGNISNEISPSHEYTDLGTYEVTLTAIVCQDTSVYNACVYLEENTICCVEVEALPIPVFSLENTDSLSISLQNISSNLYEEFTNGASIYWDFGDGNTSTEFSPNHTFAEANFYDVTLSVILCGDTTSVFETVKVGEPVGIEHIENGLVKVYPNPATTSVTFSYNIEKQETIFLYNALGQLITEIVLNPSSNSQTVSTENFVGGIYYWQLGEVNGKLIIQQ